jgi:hypothetical protein
MSSVLCVAAEEWNPMSPILEAVAFERRDVARSPGVRDPDAVRELLRLEPTLLAEVARVVVGRVHDVEPGGFVERRVPSGERNA